jgi:hypothetical protein
MSEERKPPLWPWIAAALIGLPVLYVASFGPACWIVSHSNEDLPVLPKFYVPLARLSVRSEFVHAILRRFAKVGMPSDQHYLYLPARFDTNGVYVFVVR